jgi:hypothetical protein
MKLYGYRGAEKLLGITKYSILRVAEKHPLPEPTATIDGKPGWMGGQLIAWYEARPRHGGHRRRKKS